MPRRAEQEPDRGAGLEAPEEDVGGEDGVGEGLVFGVGGVREEVRHCGAGREVRLGVETWVCDVASLSLALENWTDGNRGERRDPRGDLRPLAWSSLG